MDITERYSRQIMLGEIGTDGQRRLCGASVLIVGVGGLGSAAATYLAGAGIGRIGIADPDVVSLSNLQRQVLYDEKSVGQPKVKIAKNRITGMASTIAVECYPDGLTEQNSCGIVRNYDLVVDCTDNYSSRVLIDDVCAHVGKPWIYGSIAEFSGQLAVMNYHRGRRYRDLFPDADKLAMKPRVTLGVMGMVPGVIGALQAGEAIKLIAGFGEPLDGRIFYIDFKTFNNYTIEF